MSDFELNKKSFLVDDKTTQRDNNNFSNKDKERHYAGFWIRFGANMIDSIILSILFSALLYFYFGGIDPEILKNQANLNSIELDDSMMILNLIMNILPIFIIIAMWSIYGATPGKMILGIKIIDAKTAKTVGIGKSILRYFAMIISILPLFLGFLWIGFDKEKRGWHDIIAGTRVIYK